MKKTVIILLSIISVAMLALLLSSCGNIKEENKSKSLSLKPHTLDIVLGENVLLEAEYSENKWAEYVWTTADKNIAEVNEFGMISATGIGQTVVTVSCNGLSSSCTVNVGFGDYAPIVERVHTYGDILYASINKNYKLEYAVKFNNKYYYDAKFDYEIADNTIATIDNGVITALKYGKTTITAVGEWHGRKYASLIDIMEINVSKEVSIIVNGGKTNSVLLYTVSEFEGKHYNTSLSVEIEVYDNSNKVDDYTISLDENSSNIVSYQDGKILALSEGNTYLIVEYFDGETTYKKNVPIRVDKPVANYKEKITRFSVADGFGDITFDDIFDGEQIVSAFQVENNKILSVSNNKIMGLETPLGGKGEEKILALTKTYGYIFKVEAYTKVIRTAKDFDYFDWRPDVSYNGYYILANNIDASDYNHNSSYSFWQMNDKNDGMGLMGTFDGMGYTVDGMTITGPGIFGKVTNFATIKNVAFTNVYLGNGETMLFGRSIQSGGANGNNATLENLYIHIAHLSETAVTGAKRPGALAHCISSYAYIKNCIIEVPESRNDIGSYQDIYNGTQSTLDFDNHTSDVFVISPTPLLIYDKTKVIDSVVQHNNGSIDNEALYYPYIKRYDTIQEMRDSDNDFTSFESRFWSLTNGIPVWRNNATTVLINGKEEKEFDVLLDDLLTVTVNEQDEEKTFEILVLSGEDCIRIESNTITSIKEGTAEIKIVCGTFSKVITINVKALVITDYEQVMTGFSAIDGTGDISFETIFGDDIIVSAYQGDQSRPLTVKNENGVQKIFGVETSSVGMTETVITVLATKRGFNITLNGYTKIIKSADDLSVFKLVKNGTDYSKCGGYYILANNIDASGYSFTHQQSNNAYDWAYFPWGGNGGLTGTFDGQGYTINGITLGEGGLFGVVDKTATVKNVAFTDVKWQAASRQNSVIAKYIIGGSYSDSHATLKNIYIQSNVISSNTESSVVANIINAYVNVSELIVVVPENNSSNGSFTGSHKNNLINVSNCKNIYVISPTPLAIKSISDSSSIDYDAYNTDSEKTHTGVKRYATLNEMKTDVSNDYSSFSSLYWDLSDGVPLWKVKA